jgi:uncharacterized metal-binding protein
MPSAPTHDIVTLVTAAAAVPALLDPVWALPDMNPTNTAVLVGTYLASGLLFSPDLDTHSRPYMRWRFLRFLWIPYQRFVPHRSRISHSLFLGPLIRAAYFALMLFLLGWGLFALVNLLVPFDPTGHLQQFARDAAAWMQAHPWTVAYALIGFILGGTTHVLLDTVFSRVKRIF